MEILSRGLLATESFRHSCRLTDRTEDASPAAVTGATCAIAPMNGIIENNRQKTDILGFMKEEDLIICESLNKTRQKYISF
jgi:hypothetical protein